MGMSHNPFNVKSCDASSKPYTLSKFELFSCLCCKNKY